MKKLLQIIEEAIEKYIDEKIEIALNKRDDIEKSKISDEMYTDILNETCKFSDVTKDHVLPKAKGGAGSKENIIPLCKATNKHKADKVSGVKFNKIRFSIDYKEGETIGVFKLNGTTITKEHLSYLKAHNFISESKTENGHTYHFIDTKKVSDRFNKIKPK